MGLQSDEQKTGLQRVKNNKNGITTSETRMALAKYINTKWDCKEWTPNGIATSEAETGSQKINKMGLQRLDSYHGSIDQTSFCQLENNKFTKANR